MAPDRAREASQYLLSFLARQFALLHHRFLELHRNPWLVWEPGEGAAPQVVVARSAAQTSLPGREQNRAVGAGDALCFELRRDLMDETVRYHLGRSDSGEIIVSSRPPARACGVVAYDDGWRLESSAEVLGLAIDGTPVPAEAEVPLVEGAVLEFDGVRLMFLGAGAFAKRVQLLAEQR